MNSKAAQAYFQTKVATTDQGQLLLLLYDGALNFLQQAREKMLAKDYAAKGILISKVIDIVNELSSTLNLDKGGTLAENLNNLYFLCTTRLLQANLKMDVEQLDSVVGILSGLRSAYAQIVNTPEAQKVAAQISSKLNAAGSMTQRPATVKGVTRTPVGLGQVQARMAYGQHAQQSGQVGQGVPVTPSTTTPVAPALAATTPVAPALAVPEQTAVTTIPDSLQAAPAVPAAPATPAPSAPATPAATAPATPAATAQGFAATPLNRRLASYAKMG